jgi:hypothetical protein
MFIFRGTILKPKPTEPRPTWVNFQLDAESNELLKTSSKKSRRKKREEAQLRLEDHLRRFKSISVVGVVSNEDEFKTPRQEQA